MQFKALELYEGQAYDTWAFSGDVFPMGKQLKPLVLRILREADHGDWQGVWDFPTSNIPSVLRIDLQVYKHIQHWLQGNIAGIPGNSLFEGKNRGFPPNLSQKSRRVEALPPRIPFSGEASSP